jgi:hypothetical protein
LKEGKEIIVAGSGKKGFLDGSRDYAEFHFAYNEQIIAVDSHTGFIYLAEWDNHVIRVIDPQGMNRGRKGWRWEREWK